MISLCFTFFSAVTDLYWKLSADSAAERLREIDAPADVFRCSWPFMQLGKIIHLIVGHTMSHVCLTERMSLSNSWWQTWVRNHYVCFQTLFRFFQVVQICNWLWHDSVQCQYVSPCVPRQPDMKDAVSGVCRVLHYALLRASWKQSTATWMQSTATLVVIKSKRTRWRGLAILNCNCHNCHNCHNCLADCCRMLQNVAELSESRQIHRGKCVQAQTQCESHLDRPLIRPGYWAGCGRSRNSSAGGSQVWSPNWIRDTIFSTKALIMWPLQKVL